MKCGVVVFPGSNCDHDLYYVLKHIMGQEVRFVWHKENDLRDLDAVFLPGGFSYGDYLRTGAIARFSPVMNEVIQFARKGKPVMGICNGFQILCEAGLLPGALLRNQQLDFVCKPVYIRVETTHTLFTQACQPGQVLKMPVAHGDGNYFVDAETLADIQANEQVVFRYCTAEGKIEKAANPNGSLENIAGIRNRQGNVLGMMPHPERASERLLGSDDGKMIFASLVQEALEMA
ncbi:MAG: phosphoribosylformylglycinamidine synthase subunit PurQ [Calditrichaeota bacterium]|nr:MAG: phosphoribosylformylglycinamidine synthase subunit PurQ [Calditrichota bacterium]